MRKSRLASFLVFTAGLVAAAGMAAAPAAAQTSGFPLLDGDVVVSLGDSNTAPGTYQKFVERYTAIGFPSRHIRHLNAGIGGDTAVGGLARLQRDVFDRGATVLFVTYGVNDICWGGCADEEHRQAYYQAIRDIVLQSIAHGVRVYVTTYPYTGFDRFALRDLTTTGMAIASELGAVGIDIYTTMKSLDPQGASACVAEAAQCPQAFASACRASCNTWAVSDGIHLTEKGHLAWAYALLEGLGAPDTISSVEIDAPEQTVDTATGATVTDLSWDENAQRLTFRRLDEGYPLTFGSNTRSFLSNLQVPFHTLSRYLLKVTNLPEGTYRLSVGGQHIADVTSAQLGKGLNLSTLAPGLYSYGGPWMFQNDVLVGLIAARASANRLVTLAEPGSVAAWLLSGADVLAGFVQTFTAAPSSLQVVIEPAT